MEASPPVLALSEADQAKLAVLIKDVGVAMVTTVGADGHLHSRPMACPDRGFDGSLWFFTSDDSSKAEEVSAYGLVNVAFAEPKDGTYVSISGPATLVRDPAKARALWTPAAKLWFPGGAEDPRLVLLKVDIVHAEYWDEEAGGMRVFLSLLKSVVTGRPPQRMGEHKQIG